MPIQPGQSELESNSDYFNQRPDVLTAIIKHRTKTPGNLGYLHVAAYDPVGKHVLVIYHPPPLHPDIRLELPFNPVVKGTHEVRPRMMMWARMAIDHFGIPEQPKIDYYVNPDLFPFVFPAIIGLTVLAYALFGWGVYADWFRERIEFYAGPFMLPFVAGFAILMHGVVEPGYMIYTLRKFDVPFDVMWKWVGMTVLVGFGAINEFWGCVEYERIRHIYAQTDVGLLPSRLDSFKSVKDKVQEITQEKKDL